MSSQGTGKIALNANGVSYINGGNVGIGDTSPDYRLVVKGAAATNDNIFKIEDSAGVKMASMEQDSSGNGRWIVCDTDGNADVLIHTAGNTYFNGGRVGIGTTSPSYRQLTINSSSGDVGHTFEVGGTRYWNTTVDWEIQKRRQY